MAKYKITKYKGKTKIKDLKTGNSKEIDIESFMTGGKKDKDRDEREELDQEQVNDINQSTGIEFTQAGANQLFETVGEAAAMEQIPELNYGKYAGRGYFNSNYAGGEFTISPTKSNPQNAAGYKDHLEYLQKLNPDININRRGHSNGYLPFNQRLEYGGKLKKYDVGGECKPWEPCYQNMKLGILETSGEPAPFVGPAQTKTAQGYTPMIYQPSDATSEAINMNPLTEEDSYYYNNPNGVLSGEQKNNQNAFNFMSERQSGQEKVNGLGYETKIPSFQDQGEDTLFRTGKSDLQIGANGVSVNGKSTDATNVYNPKPEIDYNIFNQYAGVDIPTAAYGLGQGIENKDALGIGLNSLKLASGLGRNIVGGIGQQNRYNQVMGDAANDLKRDKNKGQYFAYGGKMDKEMATGEYIRGVANEDTENYNAEVEQGEYLQTNQGDIAEVVGKKHSKGGEKIEMQPEDRVLSDKLKLGGETAKMLREKYDMKLKAKNTYSDVLDKFRKKMKLDKLVKEESDIIDKMDAQRDVKDVTTRDFNLQVLTQKKQEIEAEKSPIEEQRKEVFEELYNLQESSKEKGNKQINLAMGGNLESLAKEYGYTTEEAKRIVEKYEAGGKYVPKYETGEPTLELEKCRDGDEKCEERNRQLMSKSNPNSEFYNKGEHQNFTSANMAGDVNEQNYVDRMGNLLEQFPNEVQQNFDIQQGENGILNYIPRGKDIGESIGNMQKDINNRYQQLLGQIDSEITDPAQRKKMKEQVEAEMFNPNAKNRKFDSILGDFTASRKNFTLDTLRRNMEPAAYKQLPNTETPPSNEQEYLDSENIRQRNQGMGAFLFPDETPLAPTGLQGTIKPEARFERETAYQIDVVPYLQSISDREQVQMQNLEGLSPNVRAAVLSNVRAQSQDQSSRIRNQIDTQNLQNRQQVENRNTRLSNREQIQNQNYRQGFENRIYTAQANQDFDINNYYNRLQSLNAQRFEDVNNLNLTNARDENFAYVPGRGFVRKQTDLEMLQEYRNARGI